jgi:hypothetical protein
VNKAGEPLREARVSLQGSTFVVLSKTNGEFVLDSLPSGTQELEVRKLGYDVKDVAVELSAAEPARANIVMPDAVPVLAAMRVEATEDRALAKLGYLERKKMGLGYFFDGKLLNRQSLVVSDMLRVAPGITMSPSGDGRTNVLQDARNPANGCVNVYVDHFKWTDMQPGDLDNYIHPSDVVAVEVYHGSETPVEFQTSGQSSCATIVIWTIAKVSTTGDNTKAKKP